MSIPTTTSPTLRRLKPLVGKPAGTLLVHEIYRSLQGEGLHVGLPCTFIRLTACHLRCGYCDTPHAFHQGEPLELDAILARVREIGCALVQVTGGEPLLQDEVVPLMTRLADAGYTVLLETSGSIDITPVDPRVRIILDLKTPGSNEVAANLWSNLDHLKPTDEVKFVVCDRADFDWAVACTREFGLLDRCPVLIAPAHGQIVLAELANWILREGLPLRLQVQLHKIVWEPGRRGV